MIDVISAILLILGGLFGVIGGIGMLRFPDFFTRMHAAGITDTLCAFLILGGLALQIGWGLGLLKVALIAAFVAVTSPTATHALARAALAGGERPVTDSGLRDDD